MLACKETLSKLWIGIRGSPALSSYFMCDLSASEYALLAINRRSAITNLDCIAVWVKQEE